MQPPHIRKTSSVGMRGMMMSSRKGHQARGAGAGGDEVAHVGADRGGRQDELDAGVWVQSEERGAQAADGVQVGVARKRSGWPSDRTLRGSERATLRVGSG